MRRLAVYLPVVAISLDGSNRDAMLRAGAVAYLEKAGAVEDLLRAVRSVPLAPMRAPRPRSADGAGGRPLFGEEGVPEGVEPAARPVQ